MYKVTEDPAYHYEYYMLERNGVETKLSKQEYEEIYNAYKNAEVGDLIDIRNGIVAFNHIVQFFFLRY